MNALSGLNTFSMHMHAAVIPRGACRPIGRVCVRYSVLSSTARRGVRKVEYIRLGKFNFIAHLVEFYCTLNELEI